MFGKVMASMRRVGSAAGMNISPAVSSIVPDASRVLGVVQCEFEAGKLAGREYSAEISVCASPCCGCDSLEVRGLGGEPALRLAVMAETVEAEDPVAEGSGAWAAAFAAEQRPEAWAQWRALFLAAKRRQIGAMDVDTIDAAFPPWAAAGDGAMVGYRFLFRWAEGPAVELEGRRWEADDLYCIDQDCGCTEVMLVFEEAGGVGAVADEPARESVLRRDYARGSSAMLERRAGCPSPKALWEALREQQPQFDDAFFRVRHEQMRRLARRFVPAPKVDVSVPVREAPKVGRNDPCPCGTGKKFKKCCGR